MAPRRPETTTKLRRLSVSPFELNCKNGAANLKIAKVKIKLPKTFFKVSAYKF